MTTIRGVKFKYSIGEKVLCYERDPSKSKLLYTSKILDLSVNEDGQGKKMPEYLIHFYGWKNRHDRCVTEDYILPYTPENIALQNQLNEDLALILSLSSKGSRRKKLPPFLKDILEKRQSTNDDKKDYSSDSDVSEEEVFDEDAIKIDIPLNLKKKLEEDQHQIKNKKMLVRLPSDVSVVQILECYAKHMASLLCCGSLPEAPKFLENVKVAVLLCRETLDGLRVLFDFTLPYMLLYGEEQAQYIQLCRTPSQPPPPPPTNDNKKKSPAKSRSKSHKSSRSRRGGTEASQEDEAPPPKKPTLNGGSSTNSSRIGVSNILNWDILEPEFYEQNPPMPSLVYGIQHLLRLFVIMPKILKEQKIRGAKAQAIIYFVTNFLSYLEDVFSKFCSSTPYIPAPEIKEEK